MSSRKSFRATLASVSLALVVALSFGAARSAEGPPVRGVTISCQTWGKEWGEEGFGTELDELVELGANWIAIHPYARIGADGTVGHRPIDPAAPPSWLTRPIEAAHARGLSILIKPHLAYWGSPFSWRGEIDFEGEALERFFETYATFVEELARATRGADAFVVGTELDRLVRHEAAWRDIIRRVKQAGAVRTTYAANWSDYEQVPFWDALDAVGVQAYFPLRQVAEPAPTKVELVAGWEPVLSGLRTLHLRTGKPVVFTELGYCLSLRAATEPWKAEIARGAARARGRALQLACYEAALEVLDRERAWLHGAFLWKWFVGEPGHDEDDFLVDCPEVRGVLVRFWKP